MITREGYSKTNEKPIGIAITWAQKMLTEGFGNEKDFRNSFERALARDNGTWIQKQVNAPKFDIAYVYIIIGGLVAYRAQYAGHYKGPVNIIKPNGSYQTVDWNYVLLTGPLIKAPIELKRPGFQGFRYTELLF